MHVRWFLCCLYQHILSYNREIQCLVLVCIYKVWLEFEKGFALLLFVSFLFTFTLVTIDCNFIFKLHILTYERALYWFCFISTSLSLPRYDFSHKHKRGSRNQQLKLLWNIFLLRLVISNFTGKTIIISCVSFLKVHVFRKYKLMNAICIRSKQINSSSTMD